MVSKQPKIQLPTSYITVCDNNGDRYKLSNGVKNNPRDKYDLRHIVCNNNRGKPGSGCGADGRAVASKTRDPKF